MQSACQRHRCIGTFPNQAFLTLVLLFHSFLFNFSSSIFCHNYISHLNAPTQVAFNGKDVIPRKEGLNLLEVKEKTFFSPFDIFDESRGVIGIQWAFANLGWRQETYRKVRSDRE